ncbi:hypothetical protein PPROV_000508700 [Pycnococcus provasolii]|uniref:Uncharacterized protein n=1 Tax=Pycnococcus provasolii TaxID=41880 RepID=A0A830HKK0_9CHLO|nr:hypothetical protein PPROV_000508700 [Pycnococcus provasolii]
MASDASSPPALDPGGSGDDGFTGGITLQTGDVVALFIACLLIVVAAEVDRDGNVSVNTQSAVWRIRILWAEFKGLVPMSMRNVEHASKRAVEQLLVDGGGKIRSLEAKWRVEDDPARPGVCIAHCSQNVTLRLAFFPSPVRGIAARVLRANTLTVMRELKGAAECKKLM